MAREGFSGIVSIKLDGRIVLEKAYGAANRELKIPNRLDTDFAIGSRPIDFTVASVFLLADQGRLQLDDPIRKFMGGVPSDRASMTLRHLIDGRSGLPDFPHSQKDWNATLAWIDRAEFERRTMTVPLLFSPGSGQEHSHWGYNLLADIVERVSGESYYDFLSKNFFGPAGMTRTGGNGDNLGLSVSDFAEGGGPEYVGLPNTPPNWGPTSWLVMGSGGMVSTLADLKRFYAYVLSGKVLSSRYANHFQRPNQSRDGSVRGFQLFSAHDEDRSDEVYVLSNMRTGSKRLPTITRALEALIAAN